MKYTMTTPCDQCPFLKAKAHGFSMRRLKGFAGTAFPCHRTAKLDENDLDSGYEATENSGHSAVAWFEGVSGCYAVKDRVRSAA